MAAAQRRAETEQFRNNTANQLWELNQRLDRTEGRVDRVEARVDTALQYSNIVVVNSAKLEAVWQACMEDPQGQGGQALKRGVANALGAEVAEALRVPWPIPAGPAEGASEDDRARFVRVQGFYTSLKLCTVLNCYPQRQAGARKAAHFTLYLSPNLRAMELHRALVEGVERDLMHASGLTFAGEPPPPGAPTGRNFHLFPEKTRAQKQRKRRRDEDRAASAAAGGQAAGGEGAPPPPPAGAEGAQPAAAPAAKGGKAKGGTGKGQEKGKGKKGKWADGR
jgi:hypothetical protein